MITLYTIPGTDELESLSPFCMKVEVYLKLQKIPYETKSGDPRKAPKGKVPFMDADGTRIADSTAMLAYLEGKAAAPLDKGLDAADRARAHVLQRMFEESLYWPLLWSRWVDDDGWTEFKPLIERFVPAALRWLLPGIIRKKVTAQVVAQGTGRHTREEIYALGKKDIAAVAAVLGDKPYLLGDELRTIDVIGYAFLANVLLYKRVSPLTEAARSFPNLEAYVARIGKRLKADATKSDAKAA